VAFAVIDGPRVALVTGATSGIGEGVAQRLLADGWHVVSASRGDGENAPLGSVHIQTDVSDEAAVTALAEQIDARFGRLDLVVNNSGIGPQIPHPDLAAATPALWQEILGVNLFGPWRVIVAVEPLLRRSGGAHIVNVSSLAGVAVLGSSVPYAVSKAGLIHLTKLLAKALAPAIRVNSVAPGWIDTPRNEGWPQRDSIRDELVPLRRLGTPADIADAVIALQNMTYVTGEVICVDGGMHLS
jgi:ketoreductase RED2